jgi:superfamily II DNA/RNA helicase
VEHANLVVRSLLAAAAANGAAQNATIVDAFLNESSVCTSSPANTAALTEAEVASANSLPHLAMIFLNTADAALRFAQSLRSTNVQCVQYHKLCRSSERENSLRRFKAGDVSIFVCTDSAARGLDLPQVRHVVQAEFALNVVQHQHRVGRASRAGRVGKATNFVFPSSRQLVDHLLRPQQRHKQLCDSWDLDTEADGHAPCELEDGVVLPQHDDKEELLLAEDAAAVAPQPSVGIEQAFSRRRGFRRNLRRQQSFGEMLHSHEAKTDIGAI